MLLNGNLMEFKQTYGDYYVQGTTSGATITIIKRLKGVLDSSNNKISASLQAAWSNPVIKLDS